MLCTILIIWQAMDIILQQAVAQLGGERGVEPEKNLVFFLLETLKTPLSFKKMSTWRANRPPLTPSLKKINFEPPPPLIKPYSAYTHVFFLFNHILHTLLYSTYSMNSCYSQSLYYFPSCFSINYVLHVIGFPINV